MTDRSESIKPVLDLLHDYRRIWGFSDYSERGPRGGYWMSVDAYATRYGIVVLNKQYMEGDLIGWDVFVSITNSNNADVTVEALKLFLNGRG